MKVPTNYIKDIKQFMRQFLMELYPVEEIDSFFYLLMENYCGMNKNQVLTQYRKTMNESELLLVYDAVKELKLEKPIQYILGKCFFYDLDLKVDPNVLIPRPESEELVDIILKNHKKEKKIKILDIGTGSGCIAIALKKNMEEAEVYAIDISEAALQIAAENAVKNATEINFLKMDILSRNSWSGLPSYDIIVSNPPYVLESEKALMHKNVLNYEPHQALFVPDYNALMFYQPIFEFIHFNNKSVSFYLEINENKANELISLANKNGLTDICIVKDIHGKDRFLIGEKVN